MCLRGYITEGSPRKSPIRAFAWVGTRFPPPAKPVLPHFPSISCYSWAALVLDWQLKPCVHKHTKHLVGVLAFLMAILLSPVAATGQAIPSFSMRSTAPNAGSYEPITGRQRMQWFVRSTVGAESLAAGTFSAGFGTARNRPEEYGPHWDGFGKRYGIRLTGVATSHAIEGAMGSLWGEDPRYFRADRAALQRAYQECRGDDLRGAPVRRKSGTRLCPISRQRRQQLHFEYLAGGQRVQRR